MIETGWFSTRVDTTRGESVTLSVLGPGCIFGELALIRGDPLRAASIVAVSEGTTLAIEREAFDAARMRYPEMNEQLLMIVADKVTRYTTQLIEALYLPAEMRVLRRLLELTEAYPPGPIKVTQHDLASLAGTSRATANKVLKQEQGRGSLVTSRGSVRVVDRESIARRAT